MMASCYLSCAVGGEQNFLGASKASSEVLRPQEGDGEEVSAGIKPGFEHRSTGINWCSKTI